MSTIGVQDGEIIGAQAPLLAFVSSVLEVEDLGWAREQANRACKQFEIEPWLFENAPASPRSIDESYLEPAVNADIFIWLAQSETTDPVEAEVASRIESGKSLFAFFLPTETRTEQTRALQQRVGEIARYKELSDCADLYAEILAALREETRRAFREAAKKQTITRANINARLMSLYQQSKSRVVARALRFQFPQSLAEALAGDQAKNLLAPDSLGLEPGTLRVITGPVGAGKSLLAERVHQWSIQRAIKSDGQPIPVFVDARRVHEAIDDLARARTAQIGDMDHDGVAFVLDSLDEADSAEGQDMLEQVRVLVTTVPNSWALVTARSHFVAEKAERSITIPELSDNEAYALVKLAAGRDIEGHETYAWPQPTKDAIKRPLFALALGSALKEAREGRYRNKPEMIEYLVQRAPLSSSVPVASWLRWLATWTLNNGQPPQSRDLPHDFDLESVLGTGLVDVRRDVVSIGTQIAIEWFGAKAVLVDEVDIKRMLNSPAISDAWFSALSLAISIANADECDRIMGELVDGAPGYAAQVLNDMEPSRRLTLAEAEVSAPAPADAGERTVGAMGRWTSSLAKLGEVIKPRASTGAMSSLGIKQRGAGLVVSWYKGSEPLPSVTQLPDGPVLQWPHPGWGDVCSTVYDGHSWPWRWTLEVLRNSLNRVLKYRSFDYATKFPVIEDAWSFGKLALDQGTFNPDPINLRDVLSILERTIDRVPDYLTFRWNARLFTASQLHQILDHLRELRDTGVVEISSPVPEADLRIRGGLISSFYSDDQLLERTRTVYAEALGVYDGLVREYFEPLAARLNLAVNMPVKLRGYIRRDHNSREASLLYYTTALPLGCQNEVEISLNDSPPPVHDYLADAEMRSNQLRTSRPGAIGSIHPIEMMTILRIFDSSPATYLAYSWLADDLADLNLADRLITIE